jgi:hypothetical protein
MIVGRLIGWLLLFAGLVRLGFDVKAWVTSKIWAPMALGQLWYELNRSSLNLVQAVIQRYVSARLWDQIIVNVLLWWAFAFLIGLGLILLYLFRRRQPARR